MKAIIYSIKFILPVCLIVFALKAQNLCLPQSSPKELGLSAEKFEKLHSYLKALTDQKIIPGAVALLAYKGQVIHFENYGWATVETSKKMDKDQIFRIKSMSKPITSLAAMQLIEQGRLKLDDPLSKYIPEFKNSKVAKIVTDSLTGQKSISYVPSEREIKIKDLLTHSSGLAYGWLLPGLLGDIWKKVDEKEYANIGELSRALSGLPLIFQPGTTWMYSRATDVLGYVIEVASGMNLESYFREKIFKPLEMNDTYFELPERKLPRLASVYVPDTSGQLKRVNSSRDYVYPKHALSAYYSGGKRTLFTGGEGLVSTVSDYLAFAQCLMQKGSFKGKKIISEESMALMTTPYYRNISQILPGYDFGLGLGIHADQDRSGVLSAKGEFFWNGALNTCFWVDNEKQVIGILMMQVDPYAYKNILKEFKNRVYQALEKE